MAKLLKTIDFPPLSRKLNRYNYNNEITDDFDISKTKRFKVTIKSTSSNNFLIYPESFYNGVWHKINNNGVQFVSKCNRLRINGFDLDITRDRIAEIKSEWAKWLMELLPGIPIGENEQEVEDNKSEELKKHRLRLLVISRAEKIANTYQDGSQEKKRILNRINVLKTKEHRRHLRERQ
jgi:hypothetical protein